MNSASPLTSFQLSHSVSIVQMNDSEWAVTNQVQVKTHLDTGKEMTCNQYFSVHMCIWLTDMFNIIWKTHVGNHFKNQITENVCIMWNFFIIISYVTETETYFNLKPYAHYLLNESLFDDLASCVIIQLLVLSVEVMLKFSFWHIKIKRFRVTTNLGYFVIFCLSCDLLLLFLILLLCAATVT